MRALAGLQLPRMPPGSIMQGHTIIIEEVQRMSNTNQIVENGDIDRDTPQPEIHVEERRLTLHDFLKTAVKINGSDIHLQADSIPMIRVDGRARFLDCPPPPNELMETYVKQLVPDKDKWDILEH